MLSSPVSSRPTSISSEKVSLFSGFLALPISSFYLIDVGKRKQIKKIPSWIDFSGEVSGTTATLVVIDGLTVTVASVGDSRCILDTQGGLVSLLTVDHRLEENVEERERVTASGGEVGRLNLCGGQEVMGRETKNASFCFFFFFPFSLDHSYL